MADAEALVDRGRDGDVGEIQVTDYLWRVIASESLLRQCERQRRRRAHVRVVQTTALELEAGRDIEREDGRARCSADQRGGLARGCALLAVAEERVDDELFVVEVLAVWNVEPRERLVLLARHRGEPL